MFFTLAGVRVYPHSPFLLDDVQREGKPQQRLDESAPKPCIFMAKANATTLQLKELRDELHPTALMTDPDKGELPICEGRLIDQELARLLLKYQKLQSLWTYMRIGSRIPS